MADRTCSIPDCDTKVFGRGWCMKHYTRWRRTGDPGLVKREVRDRAAIAEARSKTPPGQKWCWRCEEYLPLAEYGVNRKAKDGLNSECRCCGIRRSASWRQRNPEVGIAWRRANRDRTKANVQRWRARHRGENRGYPGTRRVRLLQCAREAFTRLEIAERDGWRCQICKKRIGKSYRWPDPRSLSIDHIVPLSVGGDHTRANVQATHARCNLSKKAAGVDQLRLFG